MTSREADGGDKIAAFERGMTDAEAAMAFETSGVQAFVIEDSYLTAYTVSGSTLIEVLRRRLYDGHGTSNDVQDFIEREAETLGLTRVNAR